MSLAFDEYLDAIQPAITILGYPIRASEIFEYCRPAAYKDCEGTYHDQLVTEFFAANPKYRRTDRLTDGNHTFTAEEWAIKMLIENHQPGVNLDDLELSP